MHNIPGILSNPRLKKYRYLDKNVLLDFKDVTYVDICTLASLILIMHNFKLKGKKIGIINIPAMLKKYTNISKLDRVIQEYKSEKAALKALA